MKECSYSEYLSKLYEEECEVQCKVGMFELTRLCNFSCKMCLVRLNSEKHSLSSSRFVSIAEELFKYGLIDLTLTGGEVFTRKDFFEIYNAVYDMGILVTIMTNAYLLDDAKIQCLSIRPPHLMYVSLYGASDVTYNKICGCDNGFSIVYNNIVKLKNANIKIILQATMTQLNSHDYADILAIGKDLGIPVRTSYRIHDPIRNSDSDFEYINKIRININHIPNNFEKVTVRKNDNVTPQLRNCIGSKNYFCITNEGRLQICQNAEYPFVNLNNVNIIRAIKLLRDRTKDISCPEKCKKCNNFNFCDICVGGIYKNEDNTFVPYKSYCQYAQQVKEVLAKGG